MVVQLKATSVAVSVVLVASLFALVAVAPARSGFAGDVPAIFVQRVDVVHTTDLAVKGQVMTVLDLPQPIEMDLLSFQSGVLTRLGISISDLPPGFVTQIRLVLADATITFDGGTFSLFVPGGVVMLDGVLEVPGSIDAVFDFDPAKSVVERPADFLLKPVIPFESLAGVLVLDQSNDPATGTSFGCGDTGLSLGQSFTPSVSPLMAVELRLRAGGGFPEEGVDVTVQIREGSPDGTVLGTSSAFVKGPLAPGTQVLVLFSFVAIEVTTGHQPNDVPEVIRFPSDPLDPTDPDYLTGWMGTPYNTYDGGNMFGCGGAAVPGYDLNFRTFTA